MALLALKKYALWIHVAVVMAVYVIYKYARPDNFEYIVYTLAVAYALGGIVAFVYAFKSEDKSKAQNAWFYIMAAVLIAVVGV